MTDADRPGAVVLVFKLLEVAKKSKSKKSKSKGGDVAGRSASPEDQPPRVQRSEDAVNDAVEPIEV